MTAGFASGAIGIRYLLYSHLDFSLHLTRARSGEVHETDYLDNGEDADLENPTFAKLSVRPSQRIISDIGALPTAEIQGRAKLRHCCASSRLFT